MGKTVYIYGAAEKYGNYQRAVEAAGGRAVFGLEFSPGIAYDAVLLPGGGDLEPWRYGQENTACREMEPERDAAEFALLEQCVAARTPVLGICRGLQTVNVFFGGTLLQDIPNHSASNGTDGRHWARNAPASFLWELFGERMEVNSAHHQAAGELGQGLEAVQWAEDGTIEALFHTTLPIWAVQWHPERFGSVGLTLFNTFLRRMDADFFAKSGKKT